jgi:hypothetical protein
LLVPISGGGSTFAWNSSVSIGLLVAGILSLIGFVVVEAWFAKLPILPCRSTYHSTGSAGLQTLIDIMTQYACSRCGPQTLSWLSPSSLA